MGFTLCGKYLVSYTEKIGEELVPGNFYTLNEYELFLWRFVPGEKLQFVSRNRIFKMLKTSEELHDIKIMQFPSDPYKLICYGTGYVSSRKNPPFFTLFSVGMAPSRRTSPS